MPRSSIRAKAEGSIGEMSLPVEVSFAPLRLPLIRPNPVLSEALAVHKSTDICRYPPKTLSQGDYRTRNHKDRLTRASFRHPAANGSAAEPFVLEFREPLQILEAVDLLPGIPRQLRSELQPERRSHFRIEVPLDDVPHMRIELRFCLLYLSR